MTGPDLDEEPAEHGRYRRYLEALDGVAEADEADLVTTVLRDPVMSMAEAAVNHHVERRAARLLTDPAFTAWARMMATVIADQSFLTRRLSEWTLLRAIALDGPWTAEDLTTASDWFQRTASTAQIVSPEVLSLLAEQGADPPRSLRCEPSTSTVGSTAQLTIPPADLEPRVPKCRRP